MDTIDHVAGFLVSNHFSKTLEKFQKETKRSSFQPSNINLNDAVTQFLAPKLTDNDAISSDVKRRRLNPRDDESEDSSDSDSSSSSESSDSSDSDDSSSSSSSSDSSSDSSDSSSDDSDSDSDNDELLRKRAEQQRLKAVEAQKASEEWIQKSAVSSPQPQQNTKAPRLSGEAFRRVDADTWNREIITGLEDNSYVKQFGEDGYGAKANKVLATVKGKDFRHEKTKRKRGSYRGGNITLASNSFKYDD